MGSPVPGSKTQDYFVSVRDSHDATREDVRSWFDLIDLDDYGSFGGVV